MPCLTIPCMKGLEVAEQEDIFVVKKIVDERIVEGSYEYRVEWQGYQGQDTWEPYNNIKGRGDDAIALFNCKGSRGLPWMSGGVARGRGRGRSRGRGRGRKKAATQKPAKRRRRNEEEEEAENRVSSKEDEESDEEA